MKIAIVCFWKLFGLGHCWTHHMQTRTTEYYCCGGRFSSGEIVDSVEYRSYPSVRHIPGASLKDNTLL